MTTNKRKGLRNDSVNLATNSIDFLQTTKQVGFEGLDSKDEDRPRGRGTALLLVVFVTVLVLTGPAQAQSVSWSPAGIDSGGTGTWDTTTSQWHDGTAVGVWINGSTAVFGTTSGTVTMGAPVSTGGLTFRTTGYTLTGGVANPVTLNAGSTITVETGVTATISAPLLNDGGVNLAGPGTLQLRGAGALHGIGAVTVSNGTFDLTDGGATTGAVVTTTGTFVANNATVLLGDLTLNTNRNKMTDGLPNVASATFNNSTLRLSEHQASLAGQVYHNIVFGGPLTLNNSTVTTYQTGNGDALVTILAPSPVVMAGTNTINWQTGNFQQGLIFPRGWTGSGTVNVRSNSGSGFPSAIEVNGSMTGYTGTINANAGNGWIQFNTPDGSGWGTGNTLNVAAGARVGVNYNSNPLTRYPYVSSTATVNQPAAHLNVAGEFWTGANLSVGTFNDIGGAATGVTHLASAGKTFTVGLLNNPTDSYAGMIVGPGALVKNGTGTQILTGDNTYTGGTTINAGVLQLGNNTPTGSIVGDVVNNAALVFNRSNTYTFNGVISGPGVVNQIGSGTTILTAANSYTGGTSITGGTLQVAANENLGDAAGPLAFANGATLATTGTFTANRVTTLGTGGGNFDVADGTILTMAGMIGSLGSLTKSNAGTLVLTNANTYLGGTTINAGALQLGDGITNGSIVGDIVNKALLISDPVFGTTIAIPGTISGSGALAQIGTGTTVLTAVNTYTGGTTINAGALQLGDGTTNGSIVGDIANNALLISDPVFGTAIAIPGTISGSGAFTQLGTGTTVLTAANTYSGPTTVVAGTLRSGALNTFSPNSAMTVQSGGTSISVVSAKPSLRWPMPGSSRSALALHRAPCSRSTAT
ncbi:MAG: autotransporter-associated beta strand repeat-containing protein [Desulfobulbus sp.]|jgi:fibronectin-binding autotransporter adhesin|uniref:beta strand repeat-containing protein n=1 Tax=Desulfobulbus sp. TaxID=895 RepID=UPI002841AA63|nr:autotransporter-associated beta strand repeat-containing protein [Desulfobulbus sp.]MDR2550674.1 autotransporter-associated beta strand repeat-containing protein [Desulfobulbus sp.]